MQTHTQIASRNIALARAVTLRADQRHRSAVPYAPAPIAGDPADSVLHDDTFTFGAVICNVAGRIVSMNEAAGRLARACLGLVVRSQSHSVAASFPDESERLAVLIRAACLDGTNGSVLLRTHDRMPSLIVRVRPTPSGSAFGANHALLAISDLNARGDIGAADLIALFRLSPAQAALAVGLYDGKSFEEIAVERHVKVSTLRTHFVEVLHRTGSASLRDLIRRLGLIPPLR